MNPATLRNRLSRIIARLPRRRELTSITMMVVSRPDPNGPLKLEGAAPVLLVDDSPIPDEDAVFREEDVDTGATIFGNEVRLTAAQRAAWRSQSETERFPQSQKERRAWASAEKVIAQASNEETKGTRK
jgi:hypothetical protein